jgi:hypothetical protein
VGATKIMAGLVHTATPRYTAMQRSLSTGVSLRMQCRAASERFRGEVKLEAAERELNTTQLLKSPLANFPSSQHTALNLLPGSLR